MRCSNCGVCCTETEMLLSQKRHRTFRESRIRQKLFRQQSNKQGYIQLRNRQGYCVFYDTKKRLCSVYTDRPAGCRVYPVIVDEEKGIVLDEICQSADTITKKEKKVKGKKVIKLLQEIDFEAEQRRY